MGNPDRQRPLFPETSDTENCPQQSQPPLEQLLTIRDLARILKLSPRSIWRLLRNRQLPAPLRIGGSIRWKQADISRWLTEAPQSGKDPDMPLSEQHSE